MEKNDAGSPVSLHESAMVGFNSALFLDCDRSMSPPESEGESANNLSVEFNEIDCIGVGDHWVTFVAKDCALDHDPSSGMEVPDPNFSQPCDVRVVVILGDCEEGGGGNENGNENGGGNDNDNDNDNDKEKGEWQNQRKTAASGGRRQARWL